MGGFARVRVSALAVLLTYLVWQTKMKIPVRRDDERTNEFDSLTWFTLTMTT